MNNSCNSLDLHDGGLVALDTSEQKITYRERCYYLALLSYEMTVLSGDYNSYFFISGS